MRSVDFWPAVKLTGAIAVLAVSAACTTAPPSASKEAKGAAPETPAAPPATPAVETPPASASVSPVQPRIESSPASALPAVVNVVKDAPEVDPNVQRSYEAALQTLRAGRVAEAEAALSTLALTHPQLGGPSANLGLIYRKAGKLVESLAAFDKAVAANPEQPIFHNQRGVTLREMGRFTDARVAYERALALSPNYADARLNLGVLLDLYLVEPVPALAQFQRYLELTPGGDPAVTKWIAELKNRKPEVAASKEAS